MIDFNKYIDNFLKKDVRIKSIGVYYPSEIGGCLRKSFYSFKIPRGTDKEGMKVFQAGELIHDFAAEVFKSEKNPEVELLENESSFVIEKDNFIISGRIDNLVLLKLENKKVMVEVKSTRSIHDLEKPMDSHVMQVLLYMHAKKIYNGCVLYIEKNTLKSKSFSVKYDEVMLEKVFDRFRKLDSCLVDNVLPEAEARLDKGNEWMCGNCPYKDECYRDTPERELVKNKMEVQRAL